MSTSPLHQNIIKLASNSLIDYIDCFKFQEVVESVTSQVCKLLNAEMAGVMLYDEKSQELVLQKPAFGGNNDQKISAFRVPINGQGVGIDVFRTGVPNISNNPASDPRVSKHLFNAYPTRNIITFPLEYRSRRIGVLHVNNKKNGDFTQSDLDLLSLVSNHLTLLLENSVHYENEKKHNAELKESNQELAKQRERLQRLMGIHGKLVRSILNGEGLSVIITTLATLLNCVVVVEDKHLNVVVSSTKEGLEQRGQELNPPESLKTICKKGIMKQLFKEAGSKNKITLIPPLPKEEIHYHRVLVPLADQHSLLGYLSVLYNDKTIDEFDKIAIEQTALIASLELVKEKNIHEIETKLRGELLDELLEGAYQDSERMLSRARYFNYDFSVPQAVAVIKTNALAEVDDFSVLEKQKKRVFFLANHYFQQSLVVEKRNDVIILIPQHEEEGYWDKLENICNEVEKKFNNVQVNIGIGQFFDEIARIRESFTQANRVLDVLQKFGFPEKVLCYDNLGIFNLLYNVNEPAILKLFVEEKIGALIAYDQNNDSLLIPTLESFLKNASIREAAEELYIHVRTMKYRLKKIESILNISLKNKEKCLELNIAIKIKKVLA